MGFATSVSIEPMLSGIIEAINVIDRVIQFTTETIWIGKMNKAILRVDNEHKAKVREVTVMQRDSEILALYEELKDNPEIRWKDSIKEVVKKNGGANV